MSNTISWPLWCAVVSAMFEHPNLKIGQIDSWVQDESATLTPGGQYEEMIMVMEETIDED